MKKAYLCKTQLQIQKYTKTTREADPWRVAQGPQLFRMPDFDVSFNDDDDDDDDDDGGGDGDDDDDDSRL